MQPDWTGILTIALAQAPTMAIVALGMHLFSSRITAAGVALIEAIKISHREQLEVLRRIEEAV